MEIKYKLYPYPVLSSYSNDYGTGAFDVAIDIVTSCPLIRWYDFEIETVCFSKSKSAGVRARSSPSRTPHQ